MICICLLCLCAICICLSLCDLHLFVEFMGDLHLFVSGLDLCCVICRMVDLSKEEKCVSFFPLFEVVVSC